MKLSYSPKRKSSIALVMKFRKELETIQKGDIIDPWKRHALEKLQAEIFGLDSVLSDMNFKLSEMIDEIRFGENEKELEVIANDIGTITKRIETLENQLDTKQRGPGLTLVKECSDNKE